MNNLTSEFRYLKVDQDEVKRRSINNKKSSKVFSKAKVMAEKGIDLITTTFPIATKEDGDMEFSFMVQGEKGQYQVKATWAAVPPRGEREWFRRVKFSCDCDSFKMNRQKMYLCKHACYVMLVFFTK